MNDFDLFNVYVDDAVVVDFPAVFFIFVNVIFVNR